MAPPPPALMDELIEEFLLRLPPDDPASLARAALVCRRWRRLISDPCFRRRFRGRHHRRPPMLGFLRNIADEDESGGPGFARFVPTSSSSFRPPRADRRGFRAIDSRHGRVLLRSNSVPGPWEKGFLVWDPVADEDWVVPAPPRRPGSPGWPWDAAVLCAADLGGCSHIDCRRDPFLVAFVCTSYNKAFACVYSSQAGVWSEHTYNERIHDDCISVPAVLYEHMHIYDNFALVPAVLMAGALYFRCHHNMMIFKYDVATMGMSAIDVPDALYLQNFVLMTTEDGRIGLTYVEGSRLYLWSMEPDPQGVWGWAVNRVIELESLLPADALSRSPEAVGFAECGGFILLWTVNGFFTIDPKSNKVKNVGESHNAISIVPYESFCIPALGATSAGEGPKAGVSSASKTQIAGAKVL